MLLPSSSFWTEYYRRFQNTVCLAVSADRVLGCFVSASMFGTLRLKCGGEAHEELARPITQRSPVYIAPHYHLAP
jgi:hypothetical protein